MFKATVISTLLLASGLTFAGELTNSAAEIQNISDRISKIAERIEYGNARPRAERKLKEKLRELIGEARNMQAMLGTVRPGPRPPRPVPPRPLPPRGPMYTAECHIDDDPDFDFDQQQVQVHGSTISLLVEDCRQMAQAMYPRKDHSSGIKNLKSSGPAPRGSQTGVCHIDDDPDFDFDQIAVGTIHGLSLSDIIADCKMIAKATFKRNGSSGLKAINQNVNIPRHAVSGTCHIDDDPDMDFDQFVPGIVFGNSIRDISAQCEDLARDTFGINSASGLRNIKR